MSVITRGRLGSRTDFVRIGHGTRGFSSGTLGRGITTFAHTANGFNSCAVACGNLSVASVWNHDRLLSFAFLGPTFCESVRTNVPRMIMYNRIRAINMRQPISIITIIRQRLIINRHVELLIITRHPRTLQVTPQQAITNRNMAIPRYTIGRSFNRRIARHDRQIMRFISHLNQRTMRRMYICRGQIKYRITRALNHTLRDCSLISRFRRAEQDRFRSTQCHGATQTR